MNVMNSVQEHYKDALEHFNSNQIIGIFLQGSQNYGLETPFSDVDTKLITIPTLKELALNKKPISTTFVRANNEHIDFKDFRLMFQTFKKQNLNFLEVLFTKYEIVNEKYKKYWNIVKENAEDIAHYNIYKTVKAMGGVAMNRYNSMTKETPANRDKIQEFGYEPKQLHHLVRIHEFIEKYLAGEKYANCLKASYPDSLKAIKLGVYDLKDAQSLADYTLKAINELYEKYSDQKYNVDNEKIDELFDYLQYEILKESFKEEYKE